MEVGLKWFIKQENSERAMIKFNAMPKALHKRNLNLTPWQACPTVHPPPSQGEGVMARAGREAMAWVSKSLYLADPLLPLNPRTAAS